MKLLIGAALGAAGFYFLDPENGRRRRHVAEDRAKAFLRRRSRDAQSAASYAEGVARGAAHEAAQAVTPGGGDAAERLNDPALARKVESEIFRSAEAPKGAVSVNAENGIVYLRGEVERPEVVTQLGEAAANVDGVRGVENLLHTPGSPAPMKQ
jgi:osmotically-inducible protein OsmY